MLIGLVLPVPQFPTPSAVALFPLDSTNTGIYLRQFRSHDPLHSSDARFIDLAAAVKRGIIPIEYYRTDDGVVPGPGTIYHSPIYRVLHEAMRREDFALNTSGSLGPKFEEADASTSPLLPP
jgi:hypothetical protein